MADYSGSFSGSFTGSLLATNGVISSSAQVIGSLPIGVISGSSQIDTNSLSFDYYNLTNLPVTITPFQANSILANNALRDNFASNVKVRLNAENVLSGSLKEQLPAGTISSSLQLTSEFDERYGNELNDGLVSGSAQITLLDTDRTGFDTGDVPEGSNLYYTNQRVKSLLDTEGVISSSAQLTDTFLEVNGDGVISSSAQVILVDTNMSGFDTGDIPEGSNLYYTDARVRQILNTDNVVSSSAQITSVVTDNYMSASIAASGFGDLPDGTISSSAQISELGYITSQTDSQTLSIAGQTLSISNGNSVILPDAGGAGGGSSIWNTGSQDPSTYEWLQTSNNLKVTGSFDIKGDLTVNGQSVFIQTSASDAGAAVVVEGRLKILEEQIGSYIASASIQLGNSRDTIDCGGFF